MFTVRVPNINEPLRIHMIMNFPKRWSLCCHAIKSEYPVDSDLRATGCHIIQRENTMCDIFTPFRDSYTRIYTKTIKFNVVFVVWSMSENATRIYWFNPFPMLWFRTKFSFNEMNVGYVHVNNLAKCGQRITFMEIGQSKCFRNLNALCNQRKKFLIKLKLVIICIWQRRNLRSSKFKFTVTTLCWHLFNNQNKSQEYYVAMLAMPIVFSFSFSFFSIVTLFLSSENLTAFFAY